MAEMSTSRVPDAQLFHDAFNASPIGIAVENLDGQPLFVNPAFCAFLGFTEEELRSKHCVDFSPPEDAEKDWALFQQLKAGSIDHYQLDKRYFRKDGSLVWGRLSISLLREGSSQLVLAMVEDITEKKAREKALLWHAAVIQASDDAVVSGDLDGIIISWNSGAQRIYGYSAAEAVGKPITIILPSELPEEEKNIRERLRKGDRIEHFDTIRVTKAGERINVSLSIAPIKDSSDKIVGIVGTARNITHRKRAEEALRASEERLRLAQQGARVGIFEWNIRTGVNTWTPELEAMYGLPAGGFAGTQTAFTNLLHPDDRTRAMELAHVSLRTGQPTTGEWRVIWSDGSLHWIASRWRVFMDDSGKPLRMAGVNIDITERKLAEEKLREYERAVEGAEELILVLDREFRCLIANRAFLKRRKLAREQVVGRSLHEFVNKEIYETVIKRKLEECLRGEVVRYELKYPYPELGERDLLASYYPFEGENGFDRIACILHDITDRKRAEESVANMSRKLIEAQEQERRRIGRELHDDINQRLALVSVELSQLQQNPSGTQSRIKEIQRELDETSSDLEALSRDLHPSKIEYLGAIAGIKSWCKESAARYGIEIDFRTDLSTGLPFAVGLSLFRVVQEAVHNAVKHSGVKRIAIQLRTDGDEVHLSIRDTGKGFDVKAAMRGKGLGLTSMTERVRLIDGTISIESKPMHGTTIDVRIPLTSEDDWGELAV